MGGSSWLRARAHQPGGTGSPAKVVVGAQRGPAGGCNFKRPGHTCLGGQGVLSRRWLVLQEGLRGAAASKARAHLPVGRGSPAQVVVGAQGGPAGGCSFHQPGHTCLGGPGVLSRRWSVLKEGLRGVAAP